jgi:hypothetical protein
MEFFINDPNIQRLPPVETRFLDLRAEPDPDGKRIRVALELTPFQKRPDIELKLMDSTGKEISSASILEPVSWKLELTLHIRINAPAAGKYTLSASLSYPELGAIDRQMLVVEITSST